MFPTNNARYAIRLFFGIINQLAIEFQKDNSMTDRVHEQPNLNSVLTANALNDEVHIIQDKIIDEEIPVNIQITDNAANKVQELIDEEGNPNLKLRAYVTGGGCSGLQYGFTFDDKVEGDDMKINKNKITLLIDPTSYIYLAGSTINYVEDLEGARFVIHNPQAKTTCGCGSSFNT